jgi:hypothetical protein
MAARFAKFVVIGEFLVAVSTQPSAISHQQSVKFHFPDVIPNGFGREESALRSGNGTVGTAVMKAG